MPYKTNKALPDSVKNHLPSHACTIYREAFNHAYEHYQSAHKRSDPHESAEQVSHKVAWSAVEKQYEKGAQGQWKKKPSSAASKISKPKTKK